MTTEEKDIYAIGEIPPLGFVPKKMHAWVIRRDRHGNPMQSFKEEEFDVPEVGSNDVLIFVMAAGVNYNGVWACLLYTSPSPRDVEEARMPSSA